VTVVRAAGLSDRGRVRPGNEDHYLIGPVVAGSALWTVELDDDDPRFASEGLLCAVADGLGGHAGGEVASRATLEVYAAAGLADRDPTGVWLARLAPRAHERNEALAGADPALQGMGTTIVGVHVRRGECTVLHAGDSRCYRLREGFLQQLTKDHALPSGGVGSAPLTNCLGAGGRCEPQVQAGVELRPGDGLLLCSDGLSNAVRDLVELEALANGPGTPADRVRRLVDAANTAGGPDNVTVILIEVLES